MSDYKVSDILVIEDNASEAFELKHFFHTNNIGNVTTFVKRLSEANQAMKTRAYDVVFVDLSLPDGNGLDFVREHVTKSNAKFIVLSGSNDKKTAQLACDWGASGFISKPMSWEALHIVLRQLRGELSIGFLSKGAA